MEFRLLGPLEALAGGRPIALEAAKPRALLAILLLEANEPVSRDRLIEELWAGRPPATAAKTLQTYVSKLRKLLGDGRIETSPAGYSIRLERDELDLNRFKCLRAEGKHREALALWRGPALADFAYEPWAHAEIARLEELRRVVLEERIEADLGLGCHAELVGELEALVAEHPLRERLRGQLMLALYRSGRQAEALAAYQEARRFLVEELGLEPERRLRELEQAILRQDPALDFRPEPGALPAERRIALTVPEQESSFVGRQRELGEVCELLDAPGVRLLALTGPGGTGKTRLALEAARRSRDGFPDGVAFVDLSPIREPRLVAPSVAHALGLRQVAQREAIDALASHLRDKRLLLVVDNFEQVLDAASLLDTLASQSPNLKILVTTRVPLRLAAERVHRVPPLAREEAVALFVERAQAARPEFELTNANAATVAELCARLDGLPLALELAAARIGLLSPRAILSRIGRWLDLLRSRALDVPERHRTLRAAIEWSYELLRPEEQALFTSLAVFVGGFTADGAEAVAAGSGSDVLEGVESLLEASLLRAEHAAGDEPRFGMLETIRAYALERFAERADSGVVRNHHARFYLTLAEEAEPELRGPRQVSWLERLDSDNDNFRAALTWAGEGAEPEVGLRIGAALWRFWQMRGHLTEGREHLERLLSNRSGSRAARAAAQLSAARTAFMQGDYDAMRRFIAASMPVHRELGDEWGVSFSLMILGGAAEAQGDHEQAGKLLREALARARGRVAWVEAGALVFLSQVLEAGNELTQARRALEEGLRCARAIGDLRLIAVALMRLGSVALGQRDYEQARQRFDEGLTVQREVGDTWGIARSLTGLALAAQAGGDHRAARQFLAESLAVEREADDRAGMAATLESLANVSVSEGRPARAARLYASAGVLREAVGDWPLNVAPPEPEQVASLRAALGKAAFDAAWAKGRAMTLDDALSYALEETDLEVARTASGEA